MGQLIAQGDRQNQQITMTFEARFAPEILGNGRSSFDSVFGSGYIEMRENGLQGSCFVDALANIRLPSAKPGLACLAQGLQEKVPTAPRRSLQAAKGCKERWLGQVETLPIGQGQECHAAKVMF
jgi:hypothetical protein